MYFFFVKQKTAYEMRISDWSSDVCSSDLDGDAMAAEPEPSPQALTNAAMAMVPRSLQAGFRLNAHDVRTAPFLPDGHRVAAAHHGPGTDEPAPAILRDRRIAVKGQRVSVSA